MSVVRSQEMLTAGAGAGAALLTTGLIRQDETTEPRTKRNKRQTALVLFRIFARTVLYFALLAYARTYPPTISIPPSCIHQPSATYSTTIQYRARSRSLSLRTPHLTPCAHQSLPHGLLWLASPLSGSQASRHCHCHCQSPAIQLTNTCPG